MWRIFKNTINSQSSGPQPSWHQGQIPRETIFPWTGGGWTESGWEDGFEMIQALHLLCTLFLFLLHQLHSDHQALDSRGWEPLSKRTDGHFQRQWLGVMEELGEGDQKVQTSNYKINKFSGCNVPHDDYS